MICAKPSTLCTHSQGNIEEVFVCRYIQKLRACHHRKKNKKNKHWRSVCLLLHSKLESVPPPKKNKKQNQGREGKKLKIKIVCCVTPTMYQRWFFLSGSLWLRAIYQSWNQQWLLKLSVCTQSSPVLQCSWRIYLSNKERLIT